jgi:hypothetical protein
MAGLNADRERGVRPSSSEVARRCGVDRHTVSKCWNGGGPSPDDGRHGRPSGFDRHRDEIEGKAALPGVTAKGIHEPLLERHAGDGPPAPGRDAFTSCLGGRGMAVGRGGAPDAHPRFETAPGGRLQFDWRGDVTMHDRSGRRHRFDAYTSTLGWSRMHCFVRSPTRARDDLLACMADNIRWLGGVPAEWLTDDMPAVATLSEAFLGHAGGRARRRPGDGHRGGRGRRRALPARALPPAGEPPARRAHGVAVPPVGPGGLAPVAAALGSPGGARAVLGAVPAGNGSELSDEAALAAAAGERPGEVRLYLFSSQALRELGIPPPPGARSWARETASRPARRPPSGPCRPWAGRRGGSRGGRRSPQSRRRTPGQSSWPRASRAPRTRPPRTSRPRLPSWRQETTWRPCQPMVAVGHVWCPPTWAQATPADRAWLGDETALPLEGQPSLPECLAGSDGDGGGRRGLTSVPPMRRLACRRLASRPSWPGTLAALPAP